LATVSLVSFFLLSTLSCLLYSGSPHFAHITSSQTRLTLTWPFSPDLDYKSFTPVFSILFGLPSQILDLDRATKWALLCLVSFYIFVFAACARLSDHTQLFSPW